MLGVEELYHRYRDDVYRYLCSLTHDPAKAEDLLSETFLCAIQKTDTFRGEGGEKTWLFGIARNLWLQALRKRRPTVSYDDLLGLYVEDTVGEALDTRQLADRLRALLAELPARDGQIVQLRAEGLSYAEIAARCGIRAGSARVIEYRWNRITDRLWADTKAALAEAGLAEAQFSVWHDYIMLNGVEQAVPAEGRPPLTVDMPYDPANLPPVALLLDINCEAITDETPAAAEAYRQQAREAAQAAGLDFAAYAVTMLGADGQQYTTELAF